MNSVRELCAKAGAHQKDKHEALVHKDSGYFGASRGEYFTAVL